MNDPHVEYLTYAVIHGDSIKYEVAEPFSEETDDYIVKIEDGFARLYPQRHYATAEEAKLAAQDFVSRWNFEVELTDRDDNFKLEYAHARVIDRQPSPAPPGVVSVAVDPISFGFSATGVRVTKVAHAYPRLPIGRRLAVNDPNVAVMMERLMNYRHHREHLATMAHFCLTVVENSLNEQKHRRKQAAQHYRITKSILDCTGKLCAKGGGGSARKADGIAKPFDKKEIRFLEMAVQALIRRVAELAKNPSTDLPLINDTNLELYARRGVTEGEA